EEERRGGGQAADRRRKAATQARRERQAAGPSALAPTARGADDHGRQTTDQEATRARFSEPGGAELPGAVTGSQHPVRPDLLERVSAQADRRSSSRRGTSYRPRGVSEGPPPSPRPPACLPDVAQPCRG